MKALHYLYSSDMDECEFAHNICSSDNNRYRSLEVQVSDYRSTHEALNSATEAVTEANDLAMAQQARAVAAAAAAKEEAESVIPEPPAPAPVDTADLFSWDAPAPAAPITIFPKRFFRLDFLIVSVVNSNCRLLLSKRL